MAGSFKCFGQASNTKIDKVIEITKPLNTRGTESMCGTNFELSAVFNEQLKYGLGCAVNEVHLAREWGPCAALLYSTISPHYYLRKISRTMLQLKWINLCEPVLIIYC